MKTSYNTALTPPAPYLSVRIANLTDSVQSPVVPAKVDTGADVTAIPAAFVDQYDLVPAGEFQVEGYDGHTTTRYCYDVVLRVAQVRVVGLPVITFSADYVLLGRDVLNFLRLLLDGPALVLEILDT